MSDEPLITVKPLSDALYMFGSPSIQVGDTFTMDIMPRQSRVRRLLVRLGLRKKPKSVLTAFRVTHTT